MVIVSKDEALAAAQAALEKKAQDIVMLEISDVVAYADYFLICSGHSTIQVKAIADAVERELRSKEIRPLHIEGGTEGRWILMDFDELIVHVFLEEVREFYNLERLWNDVPRITIEEPSSSQPI